MYNMDISIGSYKCRLEIVILIVFLMIVLFGHTMFGARKSELLEGFSSNYKTVAGPQFAENNNNYSYMDPNKWSMPSLVYTAGTAPSAAVQTVLDRGKNQAPLAPGELEFFKHTEFKPECCPNTYSGSLGCACMSTQQYNTLITRGGNNVPFSEY